MRSLKMLTRNPNIINTYKHNIRRWEGLRITYQHLEDRIGDSIENLNNVNIIKARQYNYRKFYNSNKHI